MSPHRIVPVLALGAAVACAESARESAIVRVDTLPGGIPRTITSHPVDSGQWTLTAARIIQPAELDSAELLEPRDVAIADDGSV